MPCLHLKHPSKMSSFDRHSSSPSDHIVKKLPCGSTQKISSPLLFDQRFEAHFLADLFQKNPLPDRDFSGGALGSPPLMIPLAPAQSPLELRCCWCTQSNRLAPPELCLPQLEIFSQHWYVWGPRARVVSSPSHRRLLILPIRVFA